MDDAIRVLLESLSGSAASMAIVGFIGQFYEAIGIVLPAISGSQGRLSNFTRNNVSAGLERNRPIIPRGFPGSRPQSTTCFCLIQASLKNSKGGSSNRRLDRIFADRMVTDANVPKRNYWICGRDYCCKTGASYRPTCKDRSLRLRFRLHHWLPSCVK